jgi:hypothetical protein
MVTREFCSAEDHLVEDRLPIHVHTALTIQWSRIAGRGNAAERLFYIAVAEHRVTATRLALWVPVQKIRMESPSNHEQPIEYR